MKASKVIKEKKKKRGVRGGGGGKWLGNKAISYTPLKEATSTLEEASLHLQTLYIVTLLPNQPHQA